MPQNKNAKKNSMTQPGYAGTNAQKVKQEIKKDESKGIGAMTAREAGSMRE